MGEQHFNFLAQSSRDAAFPRACDLACHVTGAFGRSIAERILRLAAGKPSWPEIDGVKAIDWLATKSSFALADSQKQAVDSRFARKCSSSPAVLASARRPL